jgi:hypothetical protein
VKRKIGPRPLCMCTPRPNNHRVGPSYLSRRAFKADYGSYIETSKRSFSPLTNVRWVQHTVHARATHYGRASFQFWELDKINWQKAGRLVTRVAEDETNIKSRRQCRRRDQQLVTLLRVQWLHHSLNPRSLSISCKLSSRNATLLTGSAWPFWCRAKRRYEAWQKVPTTCVCV